MNIEWIDPNTVMAMHASQIATHGGTDGIRDEGLLLSALARPENLYAYGDNPDVADLAASYAYGIAKNHPFLDGNKRTALVVSVTFLNLNGDDLGAPPPDTYVIFLGVADGSVTEDDLAVWLRERLYKIDLQ